MTNPVLLAELNERFDELLPKLLELDNLKPEAKLDVLNRIKDQYFNGNSSISANSQRFGDVSTINENYRTYNFNHFCLQLYTEFSFYYPFYKSVQNYLKFSEPNTSSLYLYRFLYKGPVSYSLLYTSTIIDFGVVHQDDTLYLFKSKYFMPFDDNPHLVDVTKTLVKFYTDFAKNGVPTNLAPTRPCTQKGTEHGKRFCDYVEFTNGIGGELAVKANDGFNFNMVDFWDDILKVVVKNQI